MTSGDAHLGTRRFAHERAVPRRVAAAFVLLSGTFTGTLINNVVNVPIREISHGVGVSLAGGTLVVTSFNLAFAILMPITGWLGDRIGRRRVFCWAVLTIAAGSGGAMAAPNIGVLVACRVVQGAGTAAVLPTVMGLLSQMYGPEQRGRALGAWAAMNGLGRAVSAPLGGYLASSLDWRWVFAPGVPLGILALCGALLWVPKSAGQSLALDWRGAVLLTAGLGLLVSGITVIPEAGVASVPVVALCGGGVVVLAVLVRSTRHRPDPFVDPSLLREPSYLRSALAAFAQMFCLSVALLATPLYLTRGHRMSTVAAGLVLFVLPAVMMVLGPVAGWMVERIGARRLLRIGMAVLVIGDGLLAATTSAAGGGTTTVLAGLLVVGMGAALVQTPAAVGATRSGAGQRGTGLGLYNMVRFVGSALGAAWVAMSLGLGSGATFVLCSLLALAGLSATWAGASAPSDPRRSPMAEREVREPDVAK